MINKITSPVTPIEEVAKINEIIDDVNNGVGANKDLSNITTAGQNVINNLISSNAANKDLSNITTAGQDVIDNRITTLMNTSGISSDWVNLNGLLVQWGITGITNNSTVTFKKAFTTEPIITTAVLSTSGDSSGSSVASKITNKSTTSFSFVTRTGGGQAASNYKTMWIAIGS